MSPKHTGEILACRAKEQTDAPDAWPIGVHVTHFATEDTLRLELLLQDSLSQIGAIIRGETIPDGPYAGRELDYSRDTAGTCVPGALPRDAIWTMELHVAAFENAQRQQRVVRFVGNGNLWANDGFVAWIGHRDRRGREVPRFGLLAPPEFDLRARPFPSLIVWRNRLPTVEPVTYRSGTRGADGFQRDASFAASGGDPGDVLWATSGQHVVRNGRPIDFADLVEMACTGDFYDLNHAFRFPWLLVANPKVFVQVGSRSLLDRAAGRGRVAAESVRAALLGAPIEADIGAEVWRDQCGFPGEAEFDHVMIEALRAAGYEEVPSPRTVGEYAIAGRVLRVCLFPGYYPHSLVGVSKQGRVVLIQVTRPGGGVMIGNRSAMTVLGAARAAVAAANRSLAPYGDALADALLMDNGGDVMHWQRETNGGWAHTVESELHRDALRSLIAVVDVGTKLPHPGIRDEVYTDVAELLGARWERIAKGSVLVG